MVWALLGVYESLLLAPTLSSLAQSRFWNSVFCPGLRHQGPPSQRPSKGSVRTFNSLEPQVPTPSRSRQPPRAGVSPAHCRVQEGGEQILQTPRPGVYFRKQACRGQRRPSGASPEHGSQGELWVRSPPAAVKHEESLRQRESQVTRKRVGGSLLHARQSPTRAGRVTPVTFHRGAGLSPSVLIFFQVSSATHWYCL